MVKFLVSSPQRSLSFMEVKSKEIRTNFAKKFNSKYALSVNSATSGIYCMLMAHNIQPGDEVITSPYTMHATASSILQCGAIPVFADIEEDTFGLDPKSVEKKISKYTKGILAVNIFGHSCEVIALKKLSKKHNLFLIEIIHKLLEEKYLKIIYWSNW